MADAETALGPAFLRRLDAVTARLFRAAPGFSGLRSSHVSGGRGEFRENRPYAPGDDPARVNWPAAARTDRLVVRQHAREAEDAVTIVLDVTASMNVPGIKWRRAREIAAALGFVALRSDGRARVIPFGPPGVAPREFRGASRVHPFFDVLRRLVPAGDGHAGQVLADVLDTPGLRGPVAVVSDFTCGPRAPAPVAGLASRGREVLLVHLISAEERAPDIGRRALLRDAETGEVMAVEFDAGKAGRYAALLGERVDALRSFCRAHGARHVVVDPQWAIEDVLLRRLARA